MTNPYEVLPWDPLLITIGKFIILHSITQERNVCSSTRTYAGVLARNHPGIDVLETNWVKSLHCEHTIDIYPVYKTDK